LVVAEMWKKGKKKGDIVGKKWIMPKLLN
jgi:hypothetical protein